MQKNDVMIEQVQVIADDLAILEQIGKLEEDFFPGNSYKYDGLQVILSEQLYACYALLCDQNVVAYCIVNCNPVDKVCSVFKVAVAPAFQGQGYARMLLKYLLRQVRSIGMDEIILEVRASNKAAIAAYQNVGLEIIGTRKSYYEHPTEDAIIFRKDLFLV